MTELPLLKDKFRLQSNTLHAFQREICRNDTFKLLLKTLLKELFTTKGKILSCESVKPCKNHKNSLAFYVRKRDKSGSNSPPFQRNVQIPPSLGTMHCQMPGVCPGGMLRFRIDRRISLVKLCWCTGQLFLFTLISWLYRVRTLIGNVYLRLNDFMVIIRCLMPWICLIYLPLGKPLSGDCFSPALDFRLMFYTQGNPQYVELQRKRFLLLFPLKKHAWLFSVIVGWLGRPFLMSNSHTLTD